MSADELVRKRCRDREDYYADMRGAQNLIAEQANKIDELTAQLSEKDDEIERLREELARSKNKPVE